MDRRVILAVLLMMVVAVVPAVLFKAPPRPAISQVADSGRAGQRDSGAVGQAAAASSSLLPSAAAPAPLRPSVPASQREDTIVVTTGFYRLLFSSRGARLIGAELVKYSSMAPKAVHRPVELVRPEGSVLELTLVAGKDTIPVSTWAFAPSAKSVAVVAGSPPLTFTASERGVTVTLTYTFHPDDYRFEVAGKVDGLGPSGGFLVLGMGDGLPNNETDTLINARSDALVVKELGKSTTLLPFSKIDPGTTRQEAGPFSWVAAKSTYFVLGFFASDTAARWAAAQAEVPLGTAKYAGVARMQVSQPVTAAGTFSYRVYAGPMEYNRLSAIGDGFDDVNPYGIIGFRTVIRPFALFFRQVFVWMHTHLGISYGLAIILLSVLIRVALWPLNQKAMRSAMAMQAIQPHIKALQDRHKNDPQKAQQEMFRLYKEHGVNPLGGCLPMLLPMPILFALFFVFQSTIELRGVPFWWFTDLAGPDPLHIIPVLTGLSMFALSWMGQRGLPPNPQTKIMMYMAPVMFGLFGFRFAAGLNLYYVVSNLASLPQQWLIGRERMRRNPPTAVEAAKR